MHNILISYNLQKLQDANPNTSMYSQYQSSILMLNYMLSYTPWQLSGGIGYTRTAFNLANKNTLMTGPVLNLNKSFMKNKLSLALSFTAYRNKEDKVLAGNLSTLSFQAGLRPNRHHRFSMRFYINNSKAVDVNATSYNEKKFDVNYAYTF